MKLPSCTVRRRRMAGSYCTVNVIVVRRVAPLIEIGMLYGPAPTRAAGGGEITTCAAPIPGDVIGASGWTCAGGAAAGGTPGGVAVGGVVSGVTVGGVAAGGVAAGGVVPGGVPGWGCTSTVPGTGDDPGGAVTTAPPIVVVVCGGVAGGWPGAAAGGASGWPWMSGGRAPTPRLAPAVPCEPM